jgi:putative flippase GtrA
VSFLLFLGSGVFSTLLDLLLFGLLIHVIDRNIAFVASYAICICCRYLFDSRVTFATLAGRAAGNRFSRYFAGNVTIMVLGLCVYNLLLLLPLAMDSTLVINAGSQTWSLPPAQQATLIAKVLSIPPVTVSGYFLMKLVVFRGQETG